MWRWVGVPALVALAAGAAGAGEFILANGARVAGELANEVLMVSTGSAVVEILPEDIRELTREEIRLRDGRVVRGTLVGGRLKATTALGELAIRVEDLELYRTADAVAGPVAPASPPAGPGPAGPSQTAQGIRQVGRGATDTAKGAARTVKDGADLLHDGFKAFGEAIWEGMKGVGRAVQGVFSGS